MPLWTVESLARAMRAAPIAEAFGPVPISGISIDSRTLQPGEAFFAIKGDVFDGHAFVDQALARGAACAVVAADFAATRADHAGLLVVPDVLGGLEDAGRAARARSPARIAAVTGSVGKTSTKEMLAGVLAREGVTHAAAASFNNHWGVPLTLARMHQKAQFGVFEIGMNHAGEITPLTRMVRPHVAVITTVAPVHIEHFPNVEAIADAKAEIMVGIEPGGAIVLNHDNPHFDRLAARAQEAGVARIISFGRHEEADVRAVRIGLSAECSTVHARAFGQDVTYKIGAPGEHLALNSLAVLATAKVMGADLAMAALAFAEQRAVKGRGQRHTLTHPRGAFTLFDESYNANPVSMRAALAVVGKAETGPGGRRIAILGDMLELGPGGPADHAGLAEAIAAHRIDRVFLSGPLMQNLWAKLPARVRGAYAPTAAELQPAVLAGVGPGDVVTIKGSLGSKMGPIVEALKSQFPPAQELTQGAA